MPILHWLTREHDLHASGRAPYRLLEYVETYTMLCAEYASFIGEMLLPTYENEGNFADFKKSPITMLLSKTELRKMSCQLCLVAQNSVYFVFTLAVFVLDIQPLALASHEKTTPKQHCSNSYLLRCESRKSTFRTKKE